MNLSFWVLLLFSVAWLQASAYFIDQSSNCTQYKSCNSCVKSDYPCQWCNGCRDEGDYCDSAALSTCNETYYTIIFICVISCMVCICCCACYMRRRAMQRGETIAELLAPLIPSMARNFLFRNSLGVEGENEWMCIVCGFDNKPRSVHCTMCGTEHAFSQDYKEKKFEKHRLRKEKKLASRDNLKKNETVDIPIAEEAQITSVSMGLKYGNSAMGDTSMTQLSMNGREPPLTPAKRKEASNYRRLNQLSLRQKSARRRKTWQRRVDPKTGQLVWMRVPLSEVKVGSAPFGYTPRNSVDGKSDMYTQSLLHSNYEDSGNSRNNDYIRDLLYASENAVINSSNSSTNSGRNVSSPVAIGGKKRQVSKTSEDSFGDTHFVSGSPGYTSVFDEERGGLVWERVDQKRSSSNRGVKSPPPSTFRSIFGGQQPTPQHQQSTSTSSGGDHSGSIRAVSNDNADPSRSLFSMFSGAASPVPNSSASMSNPVGNNGSRNKKMNPEQMALLQQQYQSAANPQFDLEAVASMTYKEKLMWFLERTGELQVPWSEGFVKIEVRRSNVFLDSYHAIMSLQAADLHKWMRIQFKDEPGVDAGGLEREWFGLLVAEIFNPSNGLFSYCGGDTSTGGAYHINPTSEVNNKQHLSYFRFVGRVLGKAMMEQQSIQANLSLPLRKQIISIPITFSDLEFVDDELYRNLIWLKTNDNVSNLMLDFSISYTNTAVGGSNSAQVVYELKPGGADIAVTDSNKSEYLQLRLRHRMLDSIKSQLEYFLIGLYEVIPLDLLSVFDYQELDLLLCGVPDIDVVDWHRHTEYLGEYHKMGARHPVIRWFWKAVEAMSHEERVRLLQFTTGCARLPAQGFKALQSNDGKYRKYNIQSISKLDSIYPRAHTCFNKLDLPLYDTENELEAYLSFVVNMESTTGFTME